MKIKLFNLLSIQSTFILQLMNKFQFTQIEKVTNKYFLQKIIQFSAFSLSYKF
jgi:hypothetical protein